MGVLFPIEFKGNLTVSTVYNLGETGDIYWGLSVQHFNAATPNKLNKDQRVKFLFLPKCFNLADQSLLWYKQHYDILSD